MNKRMVKAISLVELMISIMAVGIMVLSFYSLETFSHTQVMGADRRTKVQNTLAYCLEHMSKYLQMSNQITVLANGFSLRIDSGFLQVPQTSPTPYNFTDDATISYTLTSNVFSTSCSAVLPASCGAYESINLTEDGTGTSKKKIVTGFSNSAMPSNPASGFYVYINPAPETNILDIGLVGLYDVSKSYTWATRLTNPKVAMKTRLICNNFSTH